MRIVLLGPNGQLGWELQRSLASLGELVALDRRQWPNGIGADLGDAAGLDTMLNALQPDVVVNAAAHTAVDQCETEAELAHAVNAVAPGVIARSLAKRSRWLLHFSTDYVFDGSGQAPRDEAAPTGPLSVYGRTKLDGENAIRAFSIFIA